MPETPETGDLAIDIRGVQKDYRGLRPLRIRSLGVRTGESVALLGFDQAAAEVLVNLITAASLPDSGEVLTFGQPTSAIQDATAWLTSLDQFGFISERAIVLDEMTVEQNLVMTLSMALHDIPEELRSRARAIAAEVGLATEVLEQHVSQLSASGRLRLRLGRALVPNPLLLLAEHPNASLSETDSRAFAEDYQRIVSKRKVTSVVITANRQFAETIAPRLLTLQPGTGELKPMSGWRRWFA